MREYRVRAALLAVALLLAAGYVFLPTLEENSLVNNSGKLKAEIPTEGELSWNWTPELDISDVLSLTLTGKKNAGGMTVYARLTEENGTEAAALAQAVDEMGKSDRISLTGRFEKGKKYTLSVHAEGEGNLKLKGSEDEEGNFYPMLRENGTAVGKNAVTLYFALGVLLIALTPVSGNSKPASAMRKRETSRLSAFLPWATFVLLVSLGAVMTVVRPVADVGEPWRSFDEEIHWKLLPGMNLFREDGLRLVNQSMITWNPGYLPLAIGYNLAAIFTGNTEVLYRVSVGFSMLVYAGTCALAVMHAPRYKASFLVAGTIPMFVFQMVSITYDMVVIGSILLGLSLVLETIDREEPLSSLRAMGLTALMAFGTVAKPAYSLLLCSLWMIPGNRFGSRRQAWMFRIFVLVLLVWCMASLAMPGGYEDVRGGDTRYAGTNSAEQIEYMLSNPVEGGLKPIRYLWGAQRFLTVESIALWGYLGGNRPLNSVYLWLLLAAAPLCTSGERWDRKSILTPGRRVTLILIAVGAEILLAYAQFLASSEVGGEMDGMQARYFLPVWIAAALGLMWPQAIRKRLGKMGDWMTGIVCLVCLGTNVYNLIMHMAEQGMLG